MMKATITKPDGTRIDVEGTLEELAELVGSTKGAPQFIFIQPQPCMRPHADGGWFAYPTFPAPAWPNVGGMFTFAPKCCCPKGEPGTVMGWGGFCPVHDVHFSVNACAIAAPNAAGSQFWLGEIGAAKALPPSSVCAAPVVASA